MYIVMTIGQSLLSAGNFEHLDVQSFNFLKDKELLHSLKAQICKIVHKNVYKS
jgi:hypothetical protein